MLKSRWLLVTVPLLLIAVLVPSASAQTRLALEAGPLLPVGDLADTHDVSFYLGARWELQNVNPLGQTALLSFFLRGGYGVMRLDSETESYFEGLGESTSSSFFDAGAGMRVYANTLPVFMSAGAGFANFDGGGDADSANGFLASLGVGISKDMGGFILEIEGRGNLGFFDPENIQFISLTAGFGLPF